jgi:hypothetical protein
MTIAENIRLEQEMSIIRDPLDQTKQMSVNADGSISVSPATGSVQVVSGAAPVGHEPTENPVGISGIDGSGRKRSLLTDSIGQMMTTEQDSEVFTASASSASVLFTVDMTNWRSELLQVTNAGSGCTISYECSNNQVTWSPCSGCVVNVGTSSVTSVTSSTGLVQHIFPKRAKYFRARVSVYGSGTASATYSLTAQDAPVSVAAQVWGQTGEGTTAAGNPVTIGIEARTSNKTAVANGQVVRPIGTVDGRIVIRPHSIPEQDWYYAAAAGGILNTTTAVPLKAASASGNRHYLTSLQVRAEALSNATELAIRDGAGGTVLWRTKISSSGMPDTQFHFENPLKSTINTLLEVVTLTASGTGAVYVNAQGYSAP